MDDILMGLASNLTLWTALISWFIAQFIKILIDLTKSKRLHLNLMISSGGMPSSHTSFVTALTVSVGFVEGFGSTLFALSAITSMVVMYDAAGVRRAAGKQAEVINMLVARLESQGIVLDKKLKELLGHSPVEVAAGAILGIIVAVACISMYY